MATGSLPGSNQALKLDNLRVVEANGNKHNVWTTQNNNGNNNEPNVTFNISSSSSSRSRHTVTPDFFRKTLSKNTQKDRTSSKEVKAKLQTSEVQLGWSQKYMSWRYLMVMIMQFSYVISTFLRNCLPMAMVCMVKPLTPTSLSDSNTTRWSSNTTIEEIEDDKLRFGGREPVQLNASLYSNSTYEKNEGYEFSWTSDVQGLVLTSIMFSTFTGPVLASIIREHLGSKRTLSITNLIATILTFLSPLAARTSPYCLVAVRILLGVALGGNISVINDCLAWWAPNDEKLTMISLTFTGINVGNVLTSILSGYLCLVPFDYGWPFVFYTFGSISFAWGTCWHFLSSQRPEEHPYISEKEKQYIISQRVGMDQPSGGKKVKPPYRKLLSSVPVLAYFACGACLVWTTQVLMMYLPSFFNKRLKFSVQETGLLASLTNLFRMIGSFIWAAIGNKLMSVFDTNKSRKICICIGFVLSGISTIMVGFFDETYKWVVLGLLICIMINQSVRSSTIAALPLDMAPRYAGLLSGMHVSIGNFISISGPLITAALTTNETQEEWRTVWIIMGSVFISGATIFLIFGHASLQPWAQIHHNDKPHVASYFVNIGRRFSVFLEAPPLSPVTTFKNGFKFFQHVQIPDSNISPELSSSISGRGDDDNSYLRDRKMTEVVIETSSYFEDEIDTQCGYKKEENEDGQHDMIDLDILKPNMTNVDITRDLNTNQKEHLEQLKTYEHDGDGLGSGEHILPQVASAGTVNKAFVDVEYGSPVYSDSVQISRL